MANAGAGKNLLAPAFRLIGDLPAASLFVICLVVRVFAVDGRSGGVVTLARTSPVGAGAFPVSMRGDNES